MPRSEAQQLVALIAQAVTDIEADTAFQIPGGTPTGLNMPTVAPEDELEVNPKRRDAMRTLKAATHQLLATLMPVGLHIQELHLSYLQMVAIRTVCQARVADVIYSLDPDSANGGVHIEVLAEKCGMHPRKLSHILRFLALRNVFYECAENHWANNRCSFPLRTDSANSQWNFLIHHAETMAPPAIIEFPKLLLDKEHGGAYSWDARKSALLKYFKADSDVFTFFANSEGNFLAERFGKAMIESTKATGTGASHYKGFDWEKLGPQGILIDVGGGIGAAAYALSTYLPGWKVVVQDRSEVIRSAKKHYQEIGSSADMEFEVADFFQAQPAHRVGGADAFFLRHILHDWPAESCVEILTHLRRAAKPSTRLLICETSIEPGIPQPGMPLLSNGGMAASLSHYFNLIMMTGFNAEERNTNQFAELFERSGWKLVNVTPLATVVHRFIFEGVPEPTWSGKEK